MSYTLILCIFGCDSVPKYRQQIQSIEATYAQMPPDIARQVKVLYFLGGKQFGAHSLAGAQFIHLAGVGDDYMSASDKQFLGLNYVHEHYDADYVMTFGTDTYVNVPKLLEFLREKDARPRQEALVIGGHGDWRTVQGKRIYFHSGGPGIILSARALELLAPGLDTAVARWHRLCATEPHLRPACDVALAYFCQEPGVAAQMMCVPGLRMTHCNHRGQPCHINAVNMKVLLACHSMSPADFVEFTAILKQNNYFLA